ncbi:CSLREA domain-containing protein [Ectothiorhodospiraceae bacterium WFHF3C12]|nr:CSLREA domain-containing protein [Ectothiorhodospiraceae bacterium WFHF3C12]
MHAPTPRTHLLAILVCVLIAAPASADLITVNTTTDEDDGVGDGCSLREAVYLANQSDGITGYNQCTRQSSPENEIQLPAGTYELVIPGDGDATVGDLDVDRAMRIFGETGIPGDVVIRAGTGFDDRAFYGNAALTLEAVTVEGFGNTLEDGGVILTSNDLTVHTSVLRDNLAYRGGALYAAGNDSTSLTVYDSTLTGNRTRMASGGASATGGGIHVSRGVVDLRNSTLVNNHARNHGGGVFVGDQLMETRLDNVTLAGNSAGLQGGGLYAEDGAVMTVRSSILGDNHAGEGADDCRANSTVSEINASIASAFNLVTSPSGCEALTSLYAVTGERPRLAPLGLYDGNTPTRPPMAASSAIENGGCVGTDSSTVDYDQRGESRSGNCDIGAVERQRPALVVDSRQDAPDATLDGSCATGSGECTLRAALDEANHVPGLDEIVLADGTHTLSRSGADEDTNASGDLDVTDSLILSGSGAPDTAVDADGQDRVLDVPAHTVGTVSLLDLTLTGGSVDGNGAGLRAGLPGGGHLQINLQRLRITGNAANASSAGNSGGGAYLRYVDVRMVESLIDANTAIRKGGGVHIGDEVALELRDSIVTGNEANYLGGGVAVESGSSAVLGEHITVADNAGSSGEQLHVHLASTIQLHNSIVSGSANNCDTSSGGSIVSLGYNSVSGSGCGVGTSGDFQNTDPELGPLSSDGTPLPVREPAATSDILDYGTCEDAAGRPLPALSFGAVRAQDTATGVPSTTLTDEYGCDIGAVERQQLRAQAGSASPGDNTVNAGSTEVAVLQLTLTNEASEDFGAGSSLTLAASGTGDDGADVTTVRLYRDVNSDGRVDSGDIPLDTGTYDADDGTVTLDYSGAGASPLAAGTSADFLVAYDFSTSLTAADTVRSLLGGTMAAWAVLGLAGFSGGWRRRTIGAAAAASLLLMVAACGGGGGGGSGDGGGNGTQSSTYTVTLDGLSSTGASTGYVTQSWPPALQAATVTVTQ